MSWAIGFDTTWKRDIGYGVPALCDHPKCNHKIDRGLSYVCGNAPYGGEKGCGLYFCSEHLFTVDSLCLSCLNDDPYFEPTPDVAEWINQKLTHPSWQAWRDDNPEEVASLSFAMLY